MKTPLLETVGAFCFKRDDCNKIVKTIGLFYLELLLNYFSIA